MTQRNPLSILLHMLGLVRPLAFQMVLAVLFGTLGHLSAIAIPLLGAAAVLTGLGLLSLKLNTLFVAMICCGILRGVFAYVEQNRNHDIAFRLLALIRSQLFGALRRLCPAKLEGKNRGNLITILTADIELLEVFYAHTISPILIAILVGAVMTTIMVHFHPIYGLTALIAYLVTGVVLPILMSKKSQKLFALQREDFGNLSGYYMDSLRGLSEIQQMDCGAIRLEEIAKRTKGLEKLLHQINREEGNISALADGLVIFFGGLVLVEGFFLFDGRFATLLLPVVLMLSSFGPVLALSRLSTGLSRMLAAGNRVLNLLEETAEVTENMEGETPDFSGAEVKNLNFSYGEEEILTDLSLNFPRGKILGIHGKSGSGKSTLLKLLMRFWNPPKDSVWVGGADVGEIKTAHLRQMEGYMTQEIDLFHASIYDNIRVAKLDATLEEVQGAAEKASIHDFILTLPQGYATQVGELGDTLSSGERQRIGLARAFLQDAPLLLLDEPTSNLDSLNEAVILKSLKEEQQERTVVMVSHRKSTLSICHQTHTVERGRLT